MTALHDGWKLRSACKQNASGKKISASELSTEGRICATVPTTVVAAQMVIGVLPNPNFGDNLRRIPGTSYSKGANFENLPMPADSPYHCGWGWRYRDEFTAPVNAKSGHYWLRVGGIHYSAKIWVNEQKIADPSQIAGAYRTYDLDVTKALEPGKTNVLALETFAPTEKDLGINWVDWNPDPPDRDRRFWGKVELIATGPVAIHSPMALTHYSRWEPERCEPNHVRRTTECDGSPGAASRFRLGCGCKFRAAGATGPHEEFTLVFTPEKFPQLPINNLELWWSWQAGEPYALGFGHLAPAKVTAHAGVASTPKGREIRLHLKNNSGRLAFQVSVRVRTPYGNLTAPVTWPDDCIELTPDESRRLTARQPKDAPGDAVVKPDGWNIELATLTPAPARTVPIRNSRGAPLGAQSLENRWESQLNKVRRQGSRRFWASGIWFFTVWC